MARELKTSSSGIPATGFGLDRHDVTKLGEVSGDSAVSSASAELSERLNAFFAASGRPEPCDPEELAERRKFLAHAAQVTMGSAVLGTVHPDHSVEPLRSSSKLTSLFSRWLPAECRADYAEEFRGDLVALAREKHGRRKQLLYTLQVLIRTPQLRRALRAPASAREQPW